VRIRSRVPMIGIALMLLAAPVHAEVWMPSVFGDHMVLQEGTAVPVWGTASPGEDVRVEVAGRSARTKAGADGAWRVTLSKLGYGGPHTLTVTAASGSKTFSDVLVGEVWVASGQSNMQWSVTLARDPEKEIAAGNYPNLRLFYVERKTAETPQRDCKAQWTTTTPQTVAEFSAVAYFFGRELHQRHGVPVGMIHTSWGGTAAEAWMSRPALEANPTFSPILKRWDDIVSNYPAALAQYEKAFAAWEQERDRAKAEGRAEPERPRAPTTPGDPNRPANLYNGMIAPLLPYAIKGAIWYQGESNAGRAYQYRSLFPAMIENWRDAWGQEDFPFLFVQLANFMDRKAEPGDSAWAELREAQSMTLSLPNTGMAVAIDIGDAKDIHPKNKQEVGRRLWYAAERVAYRNRGAEETGPLYKSVAFHGNEARVTFDNARRGLMTLNGAPVKGFEIAGPDYKFVWADAQITGDAQVTVSSPSVANPVAVRYGWADNPEVTLYSGAGLPASPFRTDDRPGVTIANE
jgi:sialate O-acetylesterase